MTCGYSMNNIRLHTHQKARFSYKPPLVQPHSLHLSTVLTPALPEVSWNSPEFMFSCPPGSPFRHFCSEVSRHPYLCLQGAMMNNTGHAQAGHRKSDKGQQEGSAFLFVCFTSNIPEKLTDQDGSRRVTEGTGCITCVFLASCYP